MALNAGDPVLMDAEIKGIYRYRQLQIRVGRILGTAKPTHVSRGIFQGWSLPLYAADEELFCCECVPADWDGTSDFTVFSGGWIDTANNAKNFKMQLSYENWTAGDALGFRVRRIAASADEIAGEYVVEGLILRYVANYIGQAT